MRHKSPPDNVAP